MRRGGPTCKKKAGEVTPELAPGVRAVGVFFLSLAPALGQVTGPAADQRNRIAASNQAVSLEEHSALKDGAGNEAVAQLQHDQGSAARAMPRANPDTTAQTDALGPRRRIPRRAPDGAAETADAVSAGPWYRTALGSLAVVLAVIGGACWIARRFVPYARASGTEAVRVVGRTALSPKHTLALVHLGRRFVLVSVGGDRVRSICEVSEPDEVAELAAQTGTLLGRADRGFNATLAAEAADFLDDDIEPGAVNAETSRARSTRPLARTHAATRRPVSELLGRLRALRSN